MYLCDRKEEEYGLIWVSIPTKNEKESPLAARLRPTTLDEFVGQEHIVGKDTLLYRAIKADKLSSIILYGPPGTGKTTLAKVIANSTKSDFQQINATTAGKKDITDTVEKAKMTLGGYGRKQYCSLMRFIDLINLSKMLFCHMSKMEQ